jgi:hypothetical protein
MIRLTGMSPDVRPAVSSAAPWHSQKRWRVGLLVTAVAIVAAALAWAAFRPDERPAATDDLGLVFVVPFGAYEGVQQFGMEPVEVPRRIVFAAGDTPAVTIVNQDVFPAVVGPWRVEPGQTYTQRFPTPGVYELTCMNEQGGTDLYVITVEG